MTEDPATGGAAPQRGRPRDPKLDEAILTAAVDLLGEVGYARLTMEQVAARAQVSKPTLYLRWSNKIALVTEAISHRARPVPEAPDAGSLPDDMRSFLQSVLRSHAPAAQAVAAVSGEIANNPELRKAWRQDVAGTLTARVREILARALTRGELPAEADIDLLAMLPQALLQTWRLEYDAFPTDADVERIVQQFYTPPTTRGSAVAVSRR